MPLKDDAIASPTIPMTPSPSPDDRLLQEISALIERIPRVLQRDPVTRRFIYNGSVDFTIYESLLNMMLEILINLRLLPKNESPIEQQRRHVLHYWLNSIAHHVQKLICALHPEDLTLLLQFSQLEGLSECMQMLSKEGRDTIVPLRYLTRAYANCMDVLNEMTIITFIHQKPGFTFPTVPERFYVESSKQLAGCHYRFLKRLDASQLGYLCQLITSDDALTFLLRNIRASLAFDNKYSFVLCRYFLDVINLSSRDVLMMWFTDNHNQAMRLLLQCLIEVSVCDNRAIHCLASAFNIVMLDLKPSQVNAIFDANDLYDESALLLAVEVMRIHAGNVTVLNAFIMLIKKSSANLWMDMTVDVEQQLPVYQLAVLVLQAYDKVLYAKVWQCFMDKKPQARLRRIYECLNEGRVKQKIAVALGVAQTTVSVVNRYALMPPPMVVPVPVFGVRPKWR